MGKHEALRGITAKLDQTEKEADSIFYESYVKRSFGSLKEDRLKRVLARIPAGAQSMLDIGCGLGRNLVLLKQHYPHASLHGTDVAQAAVDAVKQLGFEAVRCDASEEIPYPNGSFDVVFCGEVIEHVVHTDHLLQEIRRVLTPNGRLLLTTPNLAYAVNRVLLLLGIQPIFTETSYHKNLGRRFKFLGQGRETQGHLKIFTAGALKEILRESGFEVTHFEGYSWIDSGLFGILDAVLRLKPEFASGFVVEATPKAPQ